MSEFLAIDFETASNRQDSACAIGIVRVSKGKIVHQECHLIRPPAPEFRFTYIHGITWADVAFEADFFGVWHRISEQFKDIDFISAHNAGFDRGVLNACCNSFGIKAPEVPYLCTVQLARRMWSLRPTKLPDVCRFLGISLEHHKADQDSLACAQIVIAAEQDGWRYDKP
jgi:DNA polymerase-3 subunit epsilon